MNGRYIGHEKTWESPQSGRINKHSAVNVFGGRGHQQLSKINNTAVHDIRSILPLVVLDIPNLYNRSSWPSQKIHKNVSWNVSLAAITQINILSYNFVSLIRHLYAACLNELHDLIKINLIFFFPCYHHIVGCWQLAKKCVICSLLLKLIKDEY